MGYAASRASSAPRTVGGAGTSSVTSCPAMRPRVRSCVGNSTPNPRHSTSPLRSITLAQTHRRSLNLVPQPQKPMLLRMKRMDRRRFVIACRHCGKLEGFAQNFPANGGPRPHPRCAPPQPEGPILTAIATRTRTGPFIPPNFVGLRMRRSNSPTRTFSPANAGLIAQFRELALSETPAEPASLRLGGNTSDYAFWKPTPAAVPPRAPSARSRWATLRPTSPTT